MRGWAAALGILLAVALAALMLRWMPAYVFIPLALAGTGYGAYRYRAATRVTPSKARADSLGLERAPADRFALAGLPFHLFSLGSDRSVEDVMYGTWGGTDVKVFDLRCVGGTDEPRRFWCALLDVQLETPWVVIEPRTFFTPPEERADLEEVAVGQAAFGEAFDVRTDDAAFVRALLDDRMREWMLAAEQEWGFEMRASFLLGYSPRTTARDSLVALQTIAGFSQRIPAAVRGRYAPRTAPPPGPLSAGLESDGPPS